MSSDFLEDVECNGVVVLLSMIVSGFAQLTILEPDTGDDNEQEGAIARFPLTPDKTGIENAKKIMDALKAWSDHVSSL